MSNELIEARLNIIAYKARILADNYKNNQLWDGDLSRGLDELENEIKAIRKASNDTRGWEYQGPG